MGPNGFKWVNGFTHSILSLYSIIPLDKSPLIPPESPSVEGVDLRDLIVMVTGPVVENELCIPQCGENFLYRWHEILCPLTQS